MGFNIALIPGDGIGPDVGGKAKIGPGVQPVGKFLIAFFYLIPAAAGEQQAGEQDQGAKTFHGILQSFDNQAYAPSCRYYNHLSGIRQILFCRTARGKTGKKSCLFPDNVIDYLC